MATDAGNRSCRSFSSWGIRVITELLRHDNASTTFQNVATLEKLKLVASGSRSRPLGDRPVYTPETPARDREGGAICSKIEALKLIAAVLDLDAALFPLDGS